MTKALAKKQQDEKRNKYMDDMGWEYQSWPGDKPTVVSLTREEMGYRITLRFDYMLGFDNDDQTQDFTLHINSINHDPMMTKQDLSLKIDDVSTQTIEDGMVSKASQIALGCYIGRKK